MEELEKPSKFDVMLLSGRVGVSFVIRGVGCFAGGYVTSNLLSLNVVGKWAITLTIAAYAFWFTGRPYSQTGVTHYKLAWQVLVRSRKRRYMKPPEYMNVNTRNERNLNQYSWREPDE